MISIQQLENHAVNIRRKIIETAHYKKQGHVGGSLSAVDILTVLYFDKLNLNGNEMRDRFVLSKGHVALGLYCTLAERGLIEMEELKTFDSFNSRLQAHPDMTRLESLDMSTGSLGQGLSTAVGMAMGAKYLSQSFHVFVLLGDGESQEGQVWEAASIAARYKLNNLTVIVDCNGLQQFGWHEENQVFPPDQHLPEKFKSFGFLVQEVDGHSIASLQKVLEQSKQNQTNQPIAIIAKTVKGKGVSFMENNYLWHSKAPNDEELDQALLQLEVGGECR
ncbi:transketolase [Solibacillus sp. MA9]|uniref:Transketolase n=1 Tax=Solibacillus palustris TaxID=2908203 RepID=A0ABS9UAN1_9BACL|nr:transketolase [Solibacillus sp. MA9]MCH7321395.1 transketolase [Solibacillus sp. MA9]